MHILPKSQYLYSDFANILQNEHIPNIIISTLTPSHRLICGGLGIREFSSIWLSSLMPIFFEFPHFFWIEIAVTVAMCGKSGNLKMKLAISVDNFRCEV